MLSRTGVPFLLNCGDPATLRKRAQALNPPVGFVSQEHYNVPYV